MQPQLKMLMADSIVQGLRYNVAGKGGTLTTEQLLQLDVKTLDEMAVALYQSNQSHSTSFRTLSTPPGQTHQRLQDNLALSVLQELIRHKETEILRESQVAEQAEQRKVLEGILAVKKQEQLQGLSVEEIEAQLAKL